MQLPDCVPPPAAAGLRSHALSCVLHPLHPLSAVCKHEPLRQPGLGHCGAEQEATQRVSMPARRGGEPSSLASGRRDPLRHDLAVSCHTHPCQPRSSACPCSAAAQKPSNVNAAIRAGALSRWGGSASAPILGVGSACLAPFLLRSAAACTCSLSPPSSLCVCPPLLPPPHPAAACPQVHRWTQ